MSQLDKRWELVVGDLRDIAARGGPLSIEMPILRGFSKYKSTFSLDGRTIEPGALFMHFPKPSQ